MGKKPLGVFCALALCLLTMSCKKLGQAAPPSGPLKYNTINFADAIPAEYGTLIAVTQDPQTPSWVALWFQRPDGAVSTVFVDIQEGRVHDKTLTIPRK